MKQKKPYELESRGSVLISATGQWHTVPHPVFEYADLAFEESEEDYYRCKAQPRPLGWWWPDVVIYPADSGGYAVKYRTSQGTATFSTLKKARAYVNEEN